MILPPDSNVVVFRDYRAADRDWVEAAHVRHYTLVEGFDPGFAAAVSGALDLLEAGLGADSGRYLIAEAAGRRVGCVFFAAETPAVGRIRLFYLEDAYRGRGIGKRMLGRVLDHARQRGYETVRVSTFDRHAAALRLYRAAGFEAVTGAPSIAFGQEMRQVDFEKDLTGPAS